MALQVASLFGVLSLDDSNFRSGLSSAKTGLSSFGSDLQKAGASVTAISAPIASLFGVATKQATDFDEAVTNTGAVLGLTRDQIGTLSSELLSIGGDTRQGPQAVADAFYDIVGGVADASTHMAILTAAIDTSAAGNANLQGTTQALISTMNSYGFAADQAAMVSDVLTQIVGKGVGTMDEFAGALPQVTGLAASLGIPLEDVGSAMAFLTTKGNSASESSTQLGAIMSAMMKPNADMLKALQEMGFSSGDLAIKQLGLVGAIQAVSNTSTAGSQGMAALLGTQEAVRGSVSLLGADYAGFRDTFVSTMDGVTERAKDIQLGSAAAEFDLLRSQVDELAISAGTALTPALLDIVKQTRPIIDDVIEWIGQNPELVSQIGLLAIGGTLLGGALFVVGTVVSAGGALITGFGALLGFFAGPLGLVALIGGAIALLAAGEGGLPGGLSRAAQAARDLVGILGILVEDKLRGFLRQVVDITNQIATALGLSTNPNSGVARTAANTAGRILGQRANGGPVMGGGAYIVGERGPELFTPGSSGYVHSNDSMGGVQISGGIQIYANTTAGGYAAMDGALARARARGY